MHPSFERAFDLKEDELIKRRVEETYNAISPHFASTRERVWPPTAEFLSECSPCHLGDLGCGTGRALIHAARLGSTVIGIDSSPVQLETAAKAVSRAGLERMVRLVRGDLENIPLEDNVLDHSIMIASLHHLPTRERRVRALDEASRCTRSCGSLQVSVWTWDQDRFRKRYLERLGGERRNEELEGPLPGDFMVPWNKGERRMRFYHLYGPLELEGEIADSGWRLSRSFFDGRNHWAECVKDL